MELDPNLSHLTSAHYQHVYEPAEDSFLFMDALKKDLPFLEKRMPPVPRSLEIGCGSGIISAYLSNILGRGIFTATDINPRAAQATAATFRNNKVSHRPAD
jgi:release factor glutamine methyltransferase